MAEHVLTVSFTSEGLVWVWAHVRWTMAQSQDAFTAAACVDDEFVRAGYTAGVERGRALGLAEGRRIG